MSIKIQGELESVAADGILADVEQIRNAVTTNTAQVITGIKTFDGSDGKRPIIVDSGDNSVLDTQITAAGVLARNLSMQKSSVYAPNGIDMYDYENDSGFDSNNHYKGVKLVKQATTPGNFDDNYDVLIIPQKSGTLATLDDIQTGGGNFVPLSRTIAGLALSANITEQQLSNALFTITEIEL